MNEYVFYILYNIIQVKTFSPLMIYFLRFNINYLTFLYKHYYKTKLSFHQCFQKYTKYQKN